MKQPEKIGDHSQFKDYLKALKVITTFIIDYISTVPSTVYILGYIVYNRVKENIVR